MLLSLLNAPAADEPYDDEALYFPKTALVERSVILIPPVKEPAEKRRLLNFLLSNCVWKAGVLTAEYRQPFDMLALAREAGGGDEAMSGAKNGQFENWLPSLDTFRTFAGQVAV